MPTAREDCPVWKRRNTQYAGYSRGGLLGAWDPTASITSPVANLREYLENLNNATTISIPHFERLIRNATSQ